jgi:hypothetical protein
MTLRSWSEILSQHDVIRFLHIQGIPPDIIHQYLVEVFGEMAMPYSTITRIIRERSWTLKNIPKRRPSNFSINAAVLRLHDHDSAASLREIVEQAKLSVLTVHYVFTTRIDYQYRRCRFVPHSLSAKQKEERLTQSRELFQVLQNAKRLH